MYYGASARSATARAPQDGEQGEPPPFVRRCRHRNPTSTALSEKLGCAVSWTTAAQGAAAALLEVTHAVVSYEAWPGPVVIRAGWEEPFEYWPAMGFTGADGRRTFVDVVYPHDEADRRTTGFAALLGDALGQRGVRLISIPERALRLDPNLRAAREVGRYSGLAVPERAAQVLFRLIHAHGGCVDLGFLREIAVDGETLVARACVLAMRRRLRLSLDRAGLDASTVRLPSQEADG